MLALSATRQAATIRSGGPAANSSSERGLDPRLAPAAHEFEASLMKEFLKPLEKDPLFGNGTGQEGTDGSGGTLMSFGTEALAQAISERGGFGIADKIIAHFEKQAETTKAGGGGSEHFLRMDRNR